MFYWMRMFNQVSMYFRIILDSVYGSSHFLIMVACLLFAFAAAIYILDQIQQSFFRSEIPGFYSDEQPEYLELTDDKFRNEVLDSFFTQYLLMLGEFELLGNEGLPGYAPWNRSLLYIYFFAATFLSQVVFFNVLVAVLSEEYGERWAMKEAYALQEQV